MPAMTKRVNVRTTVAVRNVNPPISGTKKDIIMSTSDILKCLCRRAIVEEILPDGSTIRLNMNNYYRDNGAGLDAYNTKPVKPEPPKPEAKAKVEKVNPNVVFSADINDTESEPTPEVKDETPELEVETKPDATSTEDEVTEIEAFEEINSETGEVNHNGHHKKKHRK